MRGLWHAAFALLLAGCTMGPDYHAPEIAAPAQFAELPSDKTQAPFSLAVPREADLSRWWLQIPDPQLHKLIRAALGANLDLKSAVSRIREAREQEIVAGAAALPHLSATGAAVNLHSNSNPLAGLTGGGAAGGAAAGGRTIKIYSAGFDASWELDIFGGTRRAIEAAKADTQAALWQMRDGEVSLTAEVANDYIALRAAQARIAALQAQVRAERGLLQLTAARARAGFVTQLDVNQQKVQTQSIAAEVPELQAQIRVQEHAIAVLLARQPEAMTAELDRAAPLPAIPRTLPVGLPSDLLRRRPDVRAAERKLAAATAQEGVAIAALYPKFDLLGLLSVASPTLGGLFSTRNLTRAGVGQINWPLFQGGQGRANVRAKKEEERQAYFAYRAAILKAVRDAEDALVRYAKEQQRLAALQAALQTAKASVALAKQQYKAGVANYARVLSGEQQWRAAQDQAIQSRQALAQDMIALYKALGGGWTMRTPTTARPK
jgi:NodT family efflux transporter outer membrane factor (OMF) lipoprotein